MKTRFDLEQEMLDCWGIVDDIDALINGIMDKEISVDKTSNILIGLRDLYALKFEKTFETFEEVIK